MNWELWEAKTLALLTASMVRPFILVSVAWFMLRIFRIRHPGSRHSVWTAVLVGVLLIPLLSVIAPHWGMKVVPIGHPAAAEAHLRVLSQISPTVTRVDEPLVTQTAHTSRRGRSFISAPKSVSFEDLVVWVYIAGVLVMMAYRIAGWALVRRLLARSTGLRGPRLRESVDIVTPVAIGVRRPTVLLPREWRRWSLATRRAVLRHEFAHIRRKDAVVSALARFVKCVLWFHPLAWLLSRHLANLAELACDAAVLERTLDPVTYSRILLEFANVVTRTGRRVILPDLAIAGRSGMARRIDQLFELSSGSMPKLARPVLVLTLLGAPLICVAATFGVRESMARPERPSIPLFYVPSPPSVLLPRTTPKAVPVHIAQTQSPAPAQVQKQPPVIVQAPAVPASDPVSTRPELGRDVNSTERNSATSAQAQNSAPDGAGPPPKASPGSNPPINLGPSVEPAAYTIHPQDVLLITVFREPDLSRYYSVRADGMITIPLLGDLKADGFTPLQLKKQLTETLSEKIKDPFVTVTVYEIRRFIVINRAWDFIRPSQ